MHWNATEKWHATPNLRPRPDFQLVARKSPGASPSPPGARAELERRNKYVFPYSQFSHACGDESLAPRVVRMCRRPQPQEGSHKLLLRPDENSGWPRRRRSNRNPCPRDRSRRSCATYTRRACRPGCSASCSPRRAGTSSTARSSSSARPTSCRTTQCRAHAASGVRLGR